MLLSEEGAWVVIRVAAASGIWLWVFEVFCMHACMYVSMQVLPIYIYIDSLLILLKSYAPRFPRGVWRFAKKCMSARCCMGTRGAGLCRRLVCCNMTRFSSKGEGKGGQGPTPKGQAR